MTIQEMRERKIELGYTNERTGFPGGNCTVRSVRRIRRISRIRSITSIRNG